MFQASNKSIVQVLKREYPEILEKINSDVACVVDFLPKERLCNLSELPKIIESFKAHRGINVVSFKNEVGQKKVTESREMLMAIVMLFYNPERLFNLIKRESLGLTGALSDLTGTHRALLSIALVNATVNMKAYEDFRLEVYRIYTLINIEHKLLNLNENQ